MPTDILVLGPFAFDGFSTPANLPGGGKQKVNKHQMSDGTRVVDAMGPDDDDVEWSGLLVDDFAVEIALGFDAARKAGQELNYSWAGEDRTCVITEFTYKVEKVQVVNYTIKIMFTDSSSGGLGGIIATATSLIASDLSAALSIAVQ